MKLEELRDLFASNCINKVTCNSRQVHGFLMPFNLSVIEGKLEVKE